MKLPTFFALRHSSLRSRLLLGTLVWITLTIAVTGWGLRSLFAEHVQQQLQQQLERQLNQLSASVNIDATHRIETRMIADDPRLSIPLSGLYWQIDELPSSGSTEKLAIARSRSLWDQVLALPDNTQLPKGTSNNYAVLRLHDIQGHKLLALTRPLQLPEENAPLLRLTVAADESLLAEPIQRFTTMLLITLGGLALGLLVAVVIQLRLALRPMDLLRQRLTEVRTGQAQQLQGQFPQELQPLVNEFNHVLNANADIVQRARKQAGNLAHAVHTPLSILGNAADHDATPLAKLVQEQVATAKRQVDYHLARARAASAVRATGLNTPIKVPMQALLRTMQRLHVSRHIEFSLANDPADLAFRGESQDLFEILGNLLDNAGKWAKHIVRLEVSLEKENWLCFIVDDDGSGIPIAQRQRIFERGERLDEKAAGTGLGLHIVQDLTSTYGGTIEALDAPLGGLRMRLRLPAAVKS